MVLEWRASACNAGVAYPPCLSELALSTLELRCGERQARVLSTSHLLQLQESITVQMWPHAMVSGYKSTAASGMQMHPWHLLLANNQPDCQQYKQQSFISGTC
jgi:hypothetical protein